MLASRFAIVLAALGIAATGIESAARTKATRPFDHRRHESLSCRTCHGTGERHRASFIRTPRDCAGCHHDPARGSACRDCHDLDQLTSVSGAVARLSFGVWDSAQLRRLPFAHQLHATVECRTCHGTPVTLERSRECASCHQHHHRAEADCSSCHRKPASSAHPVRAHLSCGAVQCHAPAAAPAANSSRNLCLICHDDKRTHEAGGACASCHKIPDPETAAAALGGGS